VLTINKRASISLLIAVLVIGRGGLTGLEAQTSNATVLGTVMDSSAGLIAGARVDVRNLDTGVSQSTVSDGQGRFRVPDLLVGNYDVQVSKAGFQTAVRKGIPLTIGSEVVADFTLKVGESQETITVEVDVAQVETTSAAVASLVSQTQLRELPLNGRNFEQLIELAPGVQTIPPVAAGGGGSRTFYGGQDNYSIAGSRPAGQAFLLDNTDIQGFFNHGAGSAATGSSLGVEAINEFQILTNTYSAQFGGTGAVINAASKSGTNNLHGSAYEFFRNSVMDARNFFDAGQIAPFHRNQFGGSVGGPIKKDKLFFFTNYEGLRQSLGQTSVAVVPDANAHNGILPGSPTPIPISATIAPILALYPLPNGPLFGNGTGIYKSVATQIQNENYVLARIDYQISSKDSLFARYVSDRGDQLLPFPASALSFWPELDHTKNQYFTVEERRLFSNNVLNSLRFGFVRTNESAKTATNTPALNFPGTGSLQNGLVNPGDGVSAAGASGTIPFTLVQNKFTVGDDLVWTHGAHSFKFGLAVARVQTNVAAPFNVGGDYIFPSLGGFFTDFAVVFLGMVPTSGFSTSRYFREIDLYPYIQDDWKVNSKLTLNLGLRYDYATNGVAVKEPLFAILDPLTSTGFTKVDHTLASNPNTKNFDPRIGLAYDPFNDHKTSIRAGFGIFHEQVAPRTYAPAYYLAPPSQSAFITPGGGTCGFPPIFPCFPKAFPNGPPLFTAFAGLDYRTDTSPYQIQYNLTVEREILRNTILSLGYLGSSGVHLFSERDQNPPQLLPCPGSATPAFGCDFGGTVVPNPRANPNFASLNNDAATSHSTYHSLQAAVNRRFTNNLQLQVSYTYSKCIDNGSVSSGLEQGAFEVQDPYQQALDRGRCTFDIRHNARINGVYAFPFRGNRLVEGWRVSEILSAYTGMPVTIQDAVGFDPVGLGGIEGDRPSYANPAPAGCHPNQILGSPDHWFNASCYMLNSPGQLGNIGRTTIDGPGLLNLDVALLKDTRIRENFGLQFRAEFFNVINRTNLGSPNNQVFGPGGVILPTAGQITTTATTSRQVQLALKLRF
jgi:hypothetical protein